MQHERQCLDRVSKASETRTRSWIPPELHSLPAHCCGPSPTHRGWASVGAFPLWFCVWAHSSPGRLAQFILFFKVMYTKSSLRPSLPASFLPSFLSPPSLPSFFLLLSSLPSSFPPFLPSLSKQLTNLASHLASHLHTKNSTNIHSVCLMWGHFPGTGGKSLENKGLPPGSLHSPGPDDSLLLFSQCILSPY